MKTIKSIVLLLLLTSFSQMNAQEILAKWEGLNNVNQINTKVTYIANEGNFEILGQYTAILKEHTAKLNPKSLSAELATPAVTEIIIKLNSEATSLNESAQKNAPKEEILNKIKNFGETLKSLIATCKIE